MKVISKKKIFEILCFKSEILIWIKRYYYSHYYSVKRFTIYNSIFFLRRKMSNRTGNDHSDSGEFLGLIMKRQVHSLKAEQSYISCLIGHLFVYGDAVNRRK